MRRRHFKKILRSFVKLEIEKLALGKDDVLIVSTPDYPDEEDHISAIVRLFARHGFPAIVIPGDWKIAVGVKP